MAFDTLYSQGSDGLECAAIDVLEGGKEVDKVHEVNRTLDNRKRCSMDLVFIFENYSITASVGGVTASGPFIIFPTYPQAAQVAVVPGDNE